MNSVQTGVLVNAKHSRWESKQLLLYSTVYLSVRKRESRHLGSHLDRVLLLLQTHLPLFLLLLEALDGQLSLHLQVFLQFKDRHQ